jgi:hypothetical protein
MLPKISRGGTCPASQALSAGTAWLKYRISMEVPVSQYMPLGFTYNSFQVLKYSYKCFGTRYLGRQLYLT